MKQKNKKSNNVWQRLIHLICITCGSILLVTAIVEYLGVEFILGHSETVFLCTVYVIAMLVFVISFYLQIIVHESGHMIFGWMTGYKLVSFRIGSFVLVKKEGKWKWKRMSVIGTGGQCLMDPPDFSDGKIPYILYNMGGAILNLIVTIICYILYSFRGDCGLHHVIFAGMSMAGMYSAVRNGIPMRTKMIYNDGYNVISLSKMPQALHAFWVLLKSSANSSQGNKITDLPKEWFQIPPKEYMENCNIVNHAVLVYGRMMEQGKIQEGLALADLLLEEGVAIAGLHKNMLLGDKVFFELITDNRKDVIDRYMDKQLKRFLKAMKKYPAVIRTNYAYAQLYQKDAEEAKKQKELFEKISLTFPDLAEIESEQKLMELVDLRVMEFLDKDKNWQ